MSTAATVGENKLTLKVLPTEEGAPCAVYARGQFSRFHTVHASERLAAGAVAYNADLDAAASSVEAGTVVRARQFATNRAGLGAVAQTAQLIMLDDTPPAHAQLRLCTAGGRYAHDARSGRRAYFQSSDQSVRICWDAPGFTDGESGMWVLEWQVTRRVGPDFSQSYSDLTGTQQLSPARVRALTSRPHTSAPPAFRGARASPRAPAQGSDP